MAAYERLRTEIVRSAVTDLRNAIKKSIRLGYVCDEQKSLEAWFKSKWGQALSGDNGELIIEKCHQTYKKYRSTNSKPVLPDDIQKQICKDYQDAVKTEVILERYHITSCQLYRILRRWDV